MDLCQKAESAGVSWITVHGRTTEERHQPVHYDDIKTIKDSVSVPVIANGDIKYLRDVESTHELTGVDGMFVFSNIVTNILLTVAVFFLFGSCFFLIFFIRCHGCTWVTC